MPRALGTAPHCGATDEARASRVMTGVVTEFDEAAGLGTVTGEDGTTYPFHCTQIADGTRTIPVGAPVAFDVRPWHRGRYEATAITRRPGS
jgi:CspA family cold shock protein